MDIPEDDLREPTNVVRRLEGLVLPEIRTTESKQDGRVVYLLHVEGQGRWGAISFKPILPDGRSFPSKKEALHFGRTCVFLALVRSKGFVSKLGEVPQKVKRDEAVTALEPFYHQEHGTKLKEDLAALLGTPGRGRGAKGTGSPAHGERAGQAGTPGGGGRHGAAGASPQENEAALRRTPRSAKSKGGPTPPRARSGEEAGPSASGRKGRAPRASETPAAAAAAEATEAAAAATTASSPGRYETRGAVRRPAPAGLPGAAAAAAAGSGSRLTSASRSTAAAQCSSSPAPVPALEPGRPAGVPQPPAQQPQPSTLLVTALLLLERQAQQDTAAAGAAAATVPEGPGGAGTYPQVQQQGGAAGLLLSPCTSMPAAPLPTAQGERRSSSSSMPVKQALFQQEHVGMTQPEAAKAAAVAEVAPAAGRSGTASSGSGLLRQNGSGLTLLGRSSPAERRQGAQQQVQQGSSAVQHSCPSASWALEGGHCEADAAAQAAGAGDNLGDGVSAQQAAAAAAPPQQEQHAGEQQQWPAAVIAAYEALAALLPASIAAKVATKLWLQLQRDELARLRRLQEEVEFRSQQHRLMGIHRLRRPKLRKNKCAICGDGTAAPCITARGLLCCMACAPQQAFAACSSLEVLQEVNAVAWPLLRQQVQDRRLCGSTAAAAAAGGGGGSSSSSTVAAAFRGKARQAPDPLELHDAAMRLRPTVSTAGAASSSGASSSCSPALSSSLPTLGMQGLLALLKLQTPAAAQAARRMQEDVTRLLPLLVRKGHPDMEEFAAAAARRVHVVVLGVRHYAQKLDKACMILVDLEGMLLLASRLQTAVGEERVDILRQLRRHMAAWKQHQGVPKLRLQEELRVQVVTLGLFWADQGRVQLQLVIQAEVPLAQPGASWPTLCGSGQGSYFALWESARGVGTVEGVPVPPLISKSVIKVAPAAFSTHFLGGTTDLYPVAPQPGENYCLITSTVGRPDSTRLHTLYGFGFPAVERGLRLLTPPDGEESSEFESYSLPYEQVLQRGIAASLLLKTPGFMYGPTVAETVLKKPAVKGAQAFITHALEPIIALHGGPVLAEEALPDTPTSAMASSATAPRKMTPRTFGYPPCGPQHGSPVSSAAGYGEPSSSAPGTPYSAPGVWDSPQHQQQYAGAGTRNPFASGRPGAGSPLGTPPGAAIGGSRLATSGGLHQGPPATPPGVAVPLGYDGSGWAAQQAPQPPPAQPLPQQLAATVLPGSNSASSSQLKRKAEPGEGEGLHSTLAVGAAGGGHMAAAGAGLLVEPFPGAAGRARSKRPKGALGQATPPGAMGGGGAAAGGGGGGGWVGCTGALAVGDAMEAAGGAAAEQAPVGSYASTSCEGQPLLMPSEIGLAPVRTSVAAQEGTMATTAASHLAAVQGEWPESITKQAKREKCDARRYVQKVGQPVCAHCSRQPTMEAFPSGCPGLVGKGSAAATNAAGGDSAPSTAAAAAAGGQMGGSPATKVAMWCVAGATPGMYHLDVLASRWKTEDPPAPCTAAYYCSDRAACTAAAWRAAADPEAAAAAARAPTEKAPAPAAKVPRARKGAEPAHALNGAAAGAAAPASSAAAGGGAATDAEPQLVEFPWRGPVAELEAFGPTFASMPGWMQVQDLLALQFTQDEVEDAEAARAAGQATTLAEQATELALLSNLLSWPPLLPGCAHCADCALDIWLRPGATELPPPRLLVCTAAIPAAEAAAGKKEWMRWGVAQPGCWGAHAHVVCSECRSDCCKRHGENCCMVVPWSAAEQCWQLPPKP